MKTHVPLASPGRRGTPIKVGTKVTIRRAPEQHVHVIPWQIVWDRIKLPLGVFWGVRKALTEGIEILEPCEACGRDVLASEIVWLELSCETGEYHEVGSVDPDESQGCFAFGKDCAKKIRKKLAK